MYKSVEKQLKSGGPKKTPSDTGSGKKPDNQQVPEPKKPVLTGTEKKSKDEEGHEQR